jgi:hypothetical protein
MVYFVCGLLKVARKVQTLESQVDISLFSHSDYNCIHVGFPLSPHENPAHHRAPSLVFDPSNATLHPIVHPLLALPWPLPPRNPSPPWHRFRRPRRGRQQHSAAAPPNTLPPSTGTLLAHTLYAHLQRQSLRHQWPPARRGPLHSFSAQSACSLATHTERLGYVFPASSAIAAWEKPCTARSGTSRHHHSSATTSSCSRSSLLSRRTSTPVFFGMNLPYWTSWKKSTRGMSARTSQALSDPWW